MQEVLMLQIRQALQRPTQKPARLWNALDDPVVATSAEPDKPTPVGPPILLPGEDKVRLVCAEGAISMSICKHKAEASSGYEFAGRVQLIAALDVHWCEQPCLLLGPTWTVLSLCSLALMWRLLHT